MQVTRESATVRVRQADLLSELIDYSEQYKPWMIDDAVREPGGDVVFHLSIATEPETLGKP